jgi:hypothetical protein
VPVSAAAALRLATSISLTFQDGAVVLDRPPPARPAPAGVREMTDRPLAGACLRRDRPQNADVAERARLGQNHH